MVPTLSLNQDFQNAEINSFFPLCVGTTYIHLCLCWTCEDCLYWTTNTEPIDNLLNKHHGKKDILGSVQQWSGPQVLDWSKQHAPFSHKPAHFTLCHAPGQTALHQFMLNNSREENQTCLAYGQPKMVPLSPFFLNQRGPVRFFYCSTKGFNAYSDEGLTNFSVL